ncbi:hypothetical protein [Nocardioides conyzicola]|uniref:Uncharacterized protein n=1 Tax=Nocardioides conyzicola TaxID=1651781 RepID=A0ABP8X4W2_9ACTN
MSDRANAANTVTALVVGGVLAIAVGTLLATVEWPHESTYDDAEGSAVLAYGGVLMIGLGQLALFAAVVAWAVTLGIRWSGLTNEVDYIVRRAVGVKDDTPTGRGPVTRKRSGDLTAIQPLGPVSDTGFLDEDGR